MSDFPCQSATGHEKEWHKHGRPSSPSLTGSARKKAITSLQVNLRKFARWRDHCAQLIYKSITTSKKKIYSEGTMESGNGEVQMESGTVE